ncbi:MAG: fluoride efflux transporter CrcB [Desulfovibrio sp.]|nr:fluoride efflux transporter CrcB [Desulfovibrio sp.]
MQKKKQPFGAASFWRHSVQTVLLICLGASAGALLRHWLGLWLNPLAAFLPLGTLFANLLGAFLAGLVFAFLLDCPCAEKWRPLLITGFLGALTTFSSFSLEVTSFLTQGRLLQACVTVVSHVCGSLLLTCLGFVGYGFLQRFCLHCVGRI